MNCSAGGANLHWRALVGAAAAAVALSACDTTASEPSPSPSPSAPPLQAVVASAASETCAPCVVKGKDRRLAVGVVNADGVPVAGATVAVQVFLLPAGGNPSPLGPAVTAPYEGSLLQGKGVYVVHPTFDKAGFYNVAVQASKGGLSSTTSAAFQVIDSDPGIPVGSPAPMSQNPTAAEVSSIRQIDTNVPPDDMHYTSIASALGAHHPLVIYFGSPGHCLSKTCAPEADAVRSLEPAYKPRGADFVHIETYKGGDPDNTDLSKATLSKTFDEWRLTSDPWVIVVDKQGTIAAKFDGPTAPDEIEGALRPLL